MLVYVVMKNSSNIYSIMVGFGDGLSFGNCFLKHGCVDGRNISNNVGSVIGFHDNGV